MKRNNKVDKPINFVHKFMVEQHKSVAMKSEKDYDRKRDKSELRKESWQ
ncbi:hypothetical protein [Yersinia phage vB_YenM_P778]